MKKAYVEDIKALYIKGMRIQLIKMEKEPQMPPGLQGTIDFVDDAGQIHMQWDNINSTLALIPGVDSFKIV